MNVELEPLQAEARADDDDVALSLLLDDSAGQLDLDGPSADRLALKLSRLRARLSGLADHIGGTLDPVRAGG
jgi:hypothetical protein